MIQQPLGANKRAGAMAEDSDIQQPAGDAVSRDDAAGPCCVALVVAAGRGRRFGGDLPKQYRRLAGRTVLHHSLKALCNHPRIDAVAVVIHPDDRALYDEAARGLPLLSPIEGGAERQDSVRLGLDALAAHWPVDPIPDRVLIHDGARPILSAALIDRVLDALDDHDGALPVVPVAETLKRARDDGTVAETVDRDGLYRAQTPQGFDFVKIHAAHEALRGRGFTDDAALAEAMGLSVAMVEGDEDNLKVTTERDLERAERLLHRPAPPDIRVGNGYDVHRLGEGDHIWLCGVKVAHDAGLVGHSDADVGLHALTDALLGAIGAGDIGQHFPPSDPQWRGASSDRFVAHALDLVKKAGGRVLNVDVTLVLEKPKVGPHRDAMRRRIADILGIDVSRVSLKATTTEGLGFTGRGEGVAAQATATIAIAG